MANKYFTLIVAGPVNNSPVYEGKLNRQTELPDGDLIAVQLQLGKLTITNFSRVWAERLLDKSGKPTGKLKFLKWGEPGGEQVAIRYLATSSSLDVLYQKNVEKIEPAEDGSESELFLNIGTNDYDRDVDAKFIEFIQHHSWNADNESRNPKIQTILFAEFTGETVIKNKAAEIKKRNEAESYVIEAVEKGTLIVLAHIFGLDVHEQDSSLEAKLFEKVEVSYQKFLDVIADKKTNILKLLKDAEEIQVISGKDKGEITVRESSKDVPLLPDYFQIGDSTANYLYDNFLDEKVFDAISRVERALSSYKKLMLD